MSIFNGRITTRAFISHAPTTTEPPALYDASHTLAMIPRNDEVRALICIRCGESNYWRLRYPCCPPIQEEIVELKPPQMPIFVECNRCHSKASNPEKIIHTLWCVEERMKGVCTVWNSLSLHGNCRDCGKPKEDHAQPTDDPNVFVIREKVALQTLAAFPPDVADYKDHCPSCMRGPITLANIGHALTCEKSKSNDPYR